MELDLEVSLPLDVSEEGGEVKDSEGAGTVTSGDDRSSVDRPRRHLQLRAKRILRDRPDIAILAFQGTNETKQGTAESSAGGDNPQAVIVLKQNNRTMSPNDLETIFQTGTTFHLREQTDVFYYYTALPPSPMPLTWVKVVFPAPPNEISAYTAQEIYIVRERPEDYVKFVSPFIKSVPAERNAWIEKILDSPVSDPANAKATILHNGESFVVCVDAKWDFCDIRKLHCLALVKRKDLHTVRELGSDHIPLLEEILSVGRAQILRKFGVKSDQLRVFFHHLPSFFHLHVHFCALDVDPKEFPADRAHLMDDVIENLKRDGDHYRKVSISYLLQERHPLYSQFISAQSTTTSS